MVKFKMKRFGYVFAAIVFVCSLIIFAGCSNRPMLYVGDAKLVRGVAIKYRHLGSEVAVRDDDCIAFVKELSKLPKTKMEKPAVFSSRVEPDNYWAHISLIGDTADAGRLKFYVLEEGKVQVDGLPADSWYDSQLTKTALDILTKYQGVNFNPAKNFTYYTSANAQKIVSGGEAKVEKNFYINDATWQNTIKTFLKGIENTSFNVVPKVTKINTLNNIFQSELEGQPYALILKFTSTTIADTYLFYGVVAGDNFIRIITADLTSKSKVQYILTEFAIDGKEIKNLIKALF